MRKQKHELLINFHFFLEKARKERLIGTSRFLSIRQRVRRTLMGR